jgi:hypothetical protein
MNTRSILRGPVSNLMGLPKTIKGEFLFFTMLRDLLNLLMIRVDLNSKINNLTYHKLSCTVLCNRELTFKKSV